MITLPELQQIESRIQNLGSAMRAEVLDYSEDGNLKLPIYKLSFGSTDPEAPTLGLVGGVHGLERIGAQVCVALFNSVAELARWDRQFQRTLQDVRIFFIPTVNPIGILRKTRSNPRGVDLMRNAPVEGDDPPRFLGGHRYTAKLPWYRGELNAPMEREAQALIRGVQSEISESRLAVTLDCHSGFGLQDRLWFPYAKSKEPFAELGLVHSFKNLLDQTYPHHFYKVEPQAGTYTTHGDLWDYLYQEHQGLQRGKKFLPLCLEMGSWMWVKKHPWQIFKPEGPFNPLIGHRHQRTLRRHNTLLELLVRAVSNPDVWADLSESQLLQHRQNAMELWYERA
ncbi:MAG: DUF2817 domain-containing protein [Bdellovibrio sp.]|nr:DUF2817 domain-containing protein [Bdellovibrio sp.]